MHRAIGLLTAVLLALAGAACDETPASPSAQPPSQPRLRLTLSGGSRLDNLTVLLPQDRISFGTLQGGTTSAYREVPNGVYRYAAYEYTLDGVSYRQPVIDWVGERPMDGGAFTYVLEVLPAGSFRINLVSVTQDQ